MSLRPVSPVDGDELWRRHMEAFPGEDEEGDIEKNMEGKDLPREVIEERTRLEADEEGMDEFTGRNNQGETPKIIPDTSAPAEQEIAEHMVTHIPFRSWCPFCVMGKAHIRPHQKKT